MPRPPRPPQQKTSDRRRLLWVRMIGIASAIALGSFAWRHATPEPEVREPTRHSLSHVVRVTATLSFDGHEVVLDDLIDCSALWRETGDHRGYRDPVLKPSRTWIATPLPQGGMIVWLATDLVCFLMGDTWGSSRQPEASVPPGWTPELHWYDHRDPQQAREGIIYVSETAITAPEGRLKILEPFRFTIPEHPASEPLIAEAARQTEERDFWLGRPTSSLEKSSFFSFGRVPWTLRIPEQEWRDPKRARIAGRVGGLRARHLQIQDFDALARTLDALEGTGLEFLRVEDLPGGYDSEAWKVVRNLQDGRMRQAQIGRFGIPRRGFPKEGTLFSAETMELYADNPFFPQRVDEYVPFACVDGVMTLMPETPGQIYWYKYDCSHQEHNKGVNFIGMIFENHLIFLKNDWVFDHNTQDLWLFFRR